MLPETNAEGIISCANEVVIERLGISRLDNCGYDCGDFIRFRDNKPVEKGFFVQTTSEALSKWEFTALGKDGCMFPVLVRSAPIYSNNLITGARLVIVDITERIALEEQLSRDQKMKSIGMMAGGVAHDLNNILSGIVNYPELIIQKLPEDSPLRKYVEPMKEAGLRAAAVVADLLMVARGIAAVRKIASLNEVIHDYAESPEFTELKSHFREIAYTIALDPELNNISCSAIHVRKCLMNLVTNASEAITGSGAVSISTYNTQLGSAISEHGRIEAGIYAVLSVRDTGTGISENDQEHIFEPFYSKKEMGRSGTGLGLAVVWNTMKDHGGGVRVKTHDEGTAFELYFPCTEDALESTADVDDWEEFTGNGESILIIDDELQQRDIASQLLKSLGYQVDSVSSGEEAVDLLSNKRVDLLLLDMVIGTGLNGRQTYEKVIQLYPGQKAIIISGFSESDDVKRTIQLGAGGLINKPYTKEQLARTVQSELARS